MTSTSVAAQNAALIASKAAAAASGAATAPASKTSAAASQNQLSGDINFFLTMLTTQLKNQDPTSPLDTNQFTQQIAQYSSVQQQVNMNANLEKLLASNKQSSVTTAVGYIGKEVESAGKTGEVVGGQGAFAYILPALAGSVELSIADSTGRVVFSGKGDTAAGRNIAVWDGINSSTGKQEPDGTYTLTVVAKDTAGKPMLPETRSVAIVNGVETAANGDIKLTVGRNGSVNFADVLAVRTPSRVDLTGKGSNTTTNSGA